MDARAFDRLAQALVTAGTRRAALAALLAAAGTGVGLPGQRATAQRCAANQERCSDGAECCSGVCERLSGDGEKRCRQAEHQGECTIKQDHCLDNTPGCGLSSIGWCRCYVTTQDRSFCGEHQSLHPDNCRCSSNRECEQRIGEGAKCIRARGYY